MFEIAKRAWREFKNSKPGHRFQDRYLRRNKNAPAPFSKIKVFNIAAGIAVMVIGFLLLPMPGPGSILIVLGLGMLGSESFYIARFLDWAELKLREITRRTAAAIAAKKRA